MNVDLKYGAIFFLFALLFYYFWRKSNDKFDLRSMQVWLTLTGWSVINYLMFVFHAPPLLSHINDIAFRVALPLSVVAIWVGYVSYVKWKWKR